ncbi:hypothetical protein RFC90_004038 [Klebsiella aerogenes]|nr:hypothetical protein [Klebsiella aerogenes]
MINNQLTRERLQEIAEDGFLKHGDSKALARMVLASMDSEPWGYSNGILNPAVGMACVTPTRGKNQFPVYVQPQAAAAVPEMKPADLANKFYERYPLETFKSDTERSAAFGYFMSGAELQCFGEFINYADLAGDE